MKLFIGLILLVFGFSTQAFSSPIVENVYQRSMIVPSCDVCLGGPIVTTTTFHFSEVSCSSFAGQYEVKISQANSSLGSAPETYVTIGLKSIPRDCMGPVQKRMYSISTEQIKRGERYILNNQSLLKVIPPAYL